MLSKQAPLLQSQRHVPPARKLNQVCEAELSGGSRPSLCPPVIYVSPPSKHRPHPFSCGPAPTQPASQNVTPRPRLRPRDARNLRPTSEARRASQAPPTARAGAVRTPGFGPWRWQVHPK